MFETPTTKYFLHCHWSILLICGRMFTWSEINSKDIVDQFQLIIVNLIVNDTVIVNVLKTILNIKMSIVLPSYSLEKLSEETIMFTDVAFCPENVAIVRQDHILCMPLSTTLEIGTFLVKECTHLKHNINVQDGWEKFIFQSILNPYVIKCSLIPLPETFQFPRSLTVAYIICGPSYSLEKLSEETIMFTDVAFCPENVAIVREDHILCMPLSTTLEIGTFLVKESTNI
jgi:hypothetical protein